MTTSGSTRPINLKWTVNLKVVAYTGAHPWQPVSLIVEDPNGAEQELPFTRELAQILLMGKPDVSATEAAETDINTPTQVLRLALEQKVRDTDPNRVASEIEPPEAEDSGPGSKS